jgi:hypothetical protein
MAFDPLAFSTNLAERVIGKIVAAHELRPFGELKAGIGAQKYHACEKAAGWNFHLAAAPHDTTVERIRDSRSGELMPSVAPPNCFLTNPIYPTTLRHLRDLPPKMEDANA